MAFHRHLAQYVSVVYGSWVARVSGIGSIVLLVMLVFWGDKWPILRDNKTTFVWLAIICLIVTGFDVWYQSRPDLLIENRGVFLDADSIIPEASTVTPQCVTIMLYIVNARSVPVAIKSYELAVELYGQTIVGQLVSSADIALYTTRRTDLNAIKNTLMQQGLPTEGWVRFYCGDDPRLRGQPFVLTVTDAYNIPRKIHGRIPFDYSGEIRTYLSPELYRS